jgi:hypothetical protein
MCCHMPSVAKWYFSPLQRGEALSSTNVSFLGGGEGCVDLRRGELPSTLCSFSILEIEKTRKKKQKKKRARLFFTEVMKFYMFSIITYKIERNRITILSGY